MADDAGSSARPPFTPDDVVMVTGGSGLIGKALEYMVTEGGKRINGEKWVFLSSKDANLVDRKETEAVFEKYKPTYVIHLAARVGGLFTNMKYKVEFWRENVQINDNVIDLAHEFGVEKLVSC